MKVIQTSAGQTGPYSDTRDSWQIHLEGEAMTEEEVFGYCFKNLSKRKVQTKKEWLSAFGDAGKHFAGYYTLTKSPFGYVYTHVKPFTD